MNLGLIIRISNVMVNQVIRHNSNKISNKDMLLELGITKQHLNRQLTYNNCYRLKQLESIGITKVRTEGREAYWMIDVEVFGKFLMSKKLVFA